MWYKAEYIFRNCSADYSVLNRSMHMHVRAM